MESWLPTSDLPLRREAFLLLTRLWPAQALGGQIQLPLPEGKSCSEKCERIYDAAGVGCSARSRGGGPRSSRSWPFSVSHCRASLSRTPLTSRCLHPPDQSSDGRARTASFPPRSSRVPGLTSEERGLSEYSWESRRTSPFLWHQPCCW